MKTLLIWVSMGLATMGWAEPEGRVAEIRKWYSAITEGKATSEKRIEFEAANEPLSGDVTIREFGDGLKAITLSYSAGDHGGADERFYYRKGELFFAFVEQSSWGFAKGQTTDGESITRDKLVEERLYLEQGKCIRLLRREVSAGSEADLRKLIAKVEQKTVKPDDETAELIGRGQSLLKAKTAAEILKIFAAELVPAE